AALGCGCGGDPAANDTSNPTGSGGAGGTGSAPGSTTMAGSGGTALGSGGGATSASGGAASGGAPSGGTPSASGGAANGGSGAAGASGGVAGAPQGGSGGDASGGAGGSTQPGDDGVFTLNLTLSTAIPTVGIVTFSSSVPIEKAYIDFGRDPNAFEYRAPVDLAEPDHRTLLLGMKQSTSYFVRITAEGGGQTHSSAVHTVETGFLPNGLPVMEVEDQNASALYAEGGFTVNCTGVASGGFPGGFPGGGPGGGGSRSFAFIFDKDGDQVWAYELTDTPVAECSRARMSLDGKHLWVGNFSNVSPNGALMRVPMDGMGAEQTYSFGGRHHDFGILPNGNVLFWEQENGGGYTDGSEGPDIIRELDPNTGEATDLYHEMTDFSALIEEAGGAHTNHANYVPELEAISFSLRHSSTIGLISYPEGELIAVFGGAMTTFPAMSWDVQHGHHVLADRLWVFNNNGTNGGSDILGFDFDLGGMSASPILNYSSGRSSGAFGDVKELPNGNLYVTYSTSGVIHEVSPQGALLREVTTSASLGYSEHRAMLYGPPPPYGE
ncbi:MAG TPA: aryl-sulfate sulfotransferase, partial [Polyangiaceae bacterium]|nr:aryl-sulfate sulfotransferase [Polyangiaceae bacterium]